MTTESTDLPPVIQAWVRQLLDPTFVAMIAAWPADQVDIRLSASKGKVRRLPEITFNGGPTEFVKP